MRVPKLTGFLVQYHKENRGFPAKEMNNGMNIQFLPPLAVPSGPKAAPGDSPPGKGLAFFGQAVLYLSN